MSFEMNYVQQNRSGRAQRAVIPLSPPPTSRQWDRLYCLDKLLEERIKKGSTLTPGIRYQREWKFSLVENTLDPNAEVAL